MIFLILLTLMKQVDLQREQGKLQSLGKKDKGLGCILLLQQSSVVPPAVTEGVLNEFRLDLMSLSVRGEAGGALPGPFGSAGPTATC